MLQEWLAFRDQNKIVVRRKEKRKKWAGRVEQKKSRFVFESFDVTGWILFIEQND